MRIPVKLPQFGESAAEAAPPEPPAAESASHPPPREAAWIEVHAACAGGDLGYLQRLHRARPLTWEAITSFTFLASCANRRTEVVAWLLAAVGRVPGEITRFAAREALRWEHLDVLEVLHCEGGVDLDELLTGDGGALGELVGGSAAAVEWLLRRGARGGPAHLAPCLAARLAFASVAMSLGLAALQRALGHCRACQNDEAALRRLLARAALVGDLPSAAWLRGELQLRAAPAAEPGRPPSPAAPRPEKGEPAGREPDQRALEPLCPTPRAMLATKTLSAKALPFWPDEEALALASTPPEAGGALAGRHRRRPTAFIEPGGGRLGGEAPGAAALGRPPGEVG